MSTQTAQLQELTVPNLDFKDKLVQAFAVFEQSLNGQRTSAVHAIRKQALTRFAELGFPTVRHEEWKYTNIMPALKHEYAPPVFAKHATTTLTKADIEPFLLKNVGTDKKASGKSSEQANEIVFVNGAFSKELSTIVSTKGITITSFAEALSTQTSLVEAHFAHYADWQNDAFIALNTAFAANGAFLEIAKGAVIEEPIHVVFVNDSRTQSSFAPVRNVILVGENAQATVLESVHTLTDSDNTHAGFTNVVSEIALAENAVLNHFKVQNDTEASYFVGATHVHQAASSVFTSVTITLSGGIVRNNLNAVLAGKAADTHFYGLYLTDGKTLVDNHTLADHAVAHCTSNELYKGILDGRSTGVFNGKIMVRPDAQKTLAYQSNRNILLSANATINTKPQLEIFADDVKCSHGCTSGQLDEEPLFYLRARGLNKEQARALLLYAFANDILEKITIPALREHLASLVAARLGQEML